MDFPFSMGMELRPRAPAAPAGAPLKLKLTSALYWVPHVGATNLSKTLYNVYCTLC